MRAAAWAGWMAVGLAAPALAQQVLYSPVPPKGSAYVRFANAMDGSVVVAPDFLPRQTLADAQSGRISAYAVVENVAGRALGVQVDAGDRRGPGRFMALPGSFVTVIVRPDGAAGVAVVPVVDQTDFNQTRAHLAFYNATPACGGGVLTLMPAQVAVFAQVAAGTAKSRSVNPVTASVVPSCEGKTAPAVALKGLEPGGMYSIWLMQPGAAAISLISRDQTLPYRP